MSLLSILIASLLGSPHCAAMCGGFVGIAAHSSKPRYSQLGYHLGRLLTYLILGSIGGYFGEMIDRFGVMLGINRIAAILTGSCMILSAFSMLARRNLNFARFLPKYIMHLPTRLISQSPNSTVIRGFSLGLFSTLLPCGWLYTYVALAAASANVHTGIFIMFVFWLGTLPVLLTVGSISHLLSASLVKRVPIVLAVLMLFAGFFTLSGHLTGFESHSKKTLLCLP